MAQFLLCQPNEHLPYLHLIGFMYMAHKLKYSKITDTILYNQI